MIFRCRKELRSGTLELDQLRSGTLGELPQDTRIHLFYFYGSYSSARYYWEGVVFAGRKPGQHGDARRAACAVTVRAGPELGRGRAGHEHVQEDSAHLVCDAADHHHGFFGLRFRWAVRAQASRHHRDQEGTDG